MFKKAIISLIAILLCVLFVAEPVLAANGTYNVNEEVHLTFGSQAPAQGGSTNKTTNESTSGSSVNSDITAIANMIITLLSKEPDPNTGVEKYKPAPIYVEGNDRFVYVYEDNIPRTYLEKIGSKVSVFIPGSTATDNSQEENIPIERPTDEQLGFDPMQHLKDHAAEEIGPVPEDARDSVTLIENPGTWADVDVLREELRETYGGEFVRKRIPEVPELIDFEDEYDRYNALSDYLGNEIGVDPNEKNSVMDTDIAVQYIVEYQVVDAAKSIIFKRTPRDYVYDGHHYSHYIQIENTESFNYNDFAYANKGNNGQVEFAYTFRKAGTYNIHAKQEIYKEYWDMMTYSKCEYLVIAETGQIIWKNESVGKEINPEWPTWDNRIEIQKHHDEIYEEIETQTVVIRPEDIGESVDLSMNGTYHTIRVE